MQVAQAKRGRKYRSEKLIHLERYLWRTRSLDPSKNSIMAQPTTPRKKTQRSRGKILYICSWYLWWLSLNGSAKGEKNWKNLWRGRGKNSPRKTTTNLDSSLKIKLSSRWWKKRMVFSGRNRIETLKETTNENLKRQK